MTRADAVLSDGSTVHIRPIEPSDAALLVAFHGALSPQSIYRRFFSPHPQLSDTEVARFTTVDQVDRFALVALRAGEIVAVARFDRTGDDVAEVAFIVADAHQRHGLGSFLLEELAAAARERGITRFEADTLAENRHMLTVFHSAGFPVASSMDHEVVHLAFAINETPASRAAVEEHEQRRHHPA